MLNIAFSSSGKFMKTLKPKPPHVHIDLYKSLERELCCGMMKRDGRGVECQIKHMF